MKKTQHPALRFRYFESRLAGAFGAGDASLTPACIARASY
jgi:hypothetical protein